ncbi:MAG TPA: hypothetical protein VFH70_02885 [Acidimicrobiales bacterium]|nr:hypothetical protein [Acidimicrobiales bacterium]
MSDEPSCLGRPSAASNTVADRTIEIQTGVVTVPMARARARA